MEVLKLVGALPMFEWCFEISDFRFQISHSTFHIPHSTFHIPHSTFQIRLEFNPALEI